MGVVIKDYNSADWNSIFEYSNTSPTYLRWKINIMGGEHKSMYVVRKGDVAGTFKTNTDGRKCLIVRYKTITYLAHRIIWIMHNGATSNSLLIDHIDRNPINNSITNLRAVKCETNTRNCNMSKSNSSGVAGVGFTLTGGRTYATACWKENIDGKLKQLCKYFLVKKHGLLPAFAMACKYREEQIKRLNELGYGYTENHGRENCK